MHAETREIRLDVLLIDGALILSLGLILLYLQGIMTNFLFDIIAIVSAVVLAGAAFFMIAIVDLGAALSFGAIRRPRDLIVYSLIGLAFAAGGAYLVYGPPEAIHVLLMFTIIHGLVSGGFGFAAARRRSFSHVEQIILYCFATASVSISGVMAGLAETLDDRSSIGWIGGYLCLVGLKLIFLFGALSASKRQSEPRGSDADLLPPIN